MNLRAREMIQIQAFTLHAANLGSIPVAHMVPPKTALPGAQGQE